MDLDYSLNDLFETDWDDETNNFENNVSQKDSTENQGVSSSKVRRNQDLDITLKDCFEVEWYYLSKRESVIEIIKYEPISKFIELLDSDYKLNALNDRNQTALHLLFYWKMWDSFNALDKKLSSYPFEVHNTDFIDYEGLTHLHIACARGSLSLVSRYLHNNDNINAIYHGDSHTDFTALHFTMINPKNDRTEIVKKLIEQGANVNAVDVGRRTPFHIASQSFDKSDGMISIEIMEILLNSQSNINAKDKNGNTPLLSALSSKYQEFQLDNYRYSEDNSSHVSVYMPEIKEKLKFFIQHGADLTALNNKDENVLHLILENLKLYRYQFQNSNHIFDDSDHLDMIKQILDTNPNVGLNLKNYRNETPLEMAVACMSTKIIELLLDHGADLNVLKIELEGRTREFFCYPTMVPIFEPTQDLINVLDLLFCRGFNLSLQGNIVVLQFFLHEDDDYDCSFCDCENYPYTSIKFVLQYGSKSHIEDVFNRLYHDFDLYENPEHPDYIDGYNDEHLKGTQELYSDLMEYLDTTRLGNIYSDENIKRMVTDLNEHILSRRFDSTFNYSKYIENDLNILKNTTFQNNVSLLDVLKKNPLNTPRSIVNEFDLQMIENLHCYKDAVKGHMTKARVRYFFEKYSSDYLKCIYDTLPDVCCKIIVNYLSNEDILNLCIATVKKTVKRRMTTHK